MSESEVVEVKQKKVRVRKSGYVAFQECGEGTFRLACSGSSVAAVREKIVDERLSGEFWIACIRQKVKSEVVEQLKLKAV